MKPKVAIIGSGINGLLSASELVRVFGNIPIAIYDAESSPNDLKQHRGVTLGSKDARHITITESMGFGSTIHKEALRNTPDHETAGWRLPKESSLANEALQWRKSFEENLRFEEVQDTTDLQHAELNHNGLSMWRQMIKNKSVPLYTILEQNSIDFFFETKKQYEKQLEIELRIIKHLKRTTKLKRINNDKLPHAYKLGFQVDGLAIKVRSLALNLIERLTKHTNVEFIWNTEITSSDEIDADIIIWTSGATHQSSRNIQGLVGCWAEIDNTLGLERPIKIQASAPTSVINVTPIRNTLLVSGGLGWTGHERDPDQFAVIGQIFASEINKHLSQRIDQNNIEYCIRPSSPTGQPLLSERRSRGKVELHISGSAKSGTTHAPVLAQKVVELVREATD